MMRLFRWAFTGLCLVSLLACGSTAWLWRHGRRGGQERIHLRLGWEVFALQCDSRRIVLLRLPPAQRPGPTVLQNWARRERNSNLRWFAMALAEDDPAASSVDPEAGVGPPSGSAAPGWAVPRYPVPPGDVSALFEALGDPDRFAAAHVLLSISQLRRPGDGNGGVYRDQARRQIAGVYNGLRVDLPPGGGGWNADPFFAAVYHGPAGYDPSQIPALRDFWFDRLAVPAGAVRYGTILAATMSAPLLWLALRARRSLVRRRRRRFGRCLRCGYDLTGNASGRCSECGKPTEGTGRKVVA